MPQPREKPTPALVTALERKNTLMGILLTFVVAGLGFAIARIPYASILGPMLLSILLAVLYRQWFGYPQKYATGIEISGKKLLRLAIILYGFKLNMTLIFSEGLYLLLYGALTIIMALGITMLLSRWWKADFSLSLLLAVGTGVCGAAAIAAVSPILKAKNEDTAMGVGIIALTGTIFAVGYAVLLNFYGLPVQEYGIWVGLSLHEIAHVIAAAAPAGEDVLAIALLAKLGRVFLLIPVCFLLAYWIQRRSRKQQNGFVKVKVAFPWFLLGFIVTSLFGTYFAIPQTILDTIAISSTFLLTAAMVGLGLNVSFHSIRSKALLPVASMMVASVLIAVVTFIII